MNQIQKRVKFYFLSSFFIFGLSIGCSKKDSGETCENTSECAQGLACESPWLNQSKVCQEFIAVDDALRQYGPPVEALLKSLRSIRVEIQRDEEFAPTRAIQKIAKHDLFNNTAYVPFKFLMNKKDEQNHEIGGGMPVVLPFKIQVIEADLKGEAAWKKGKLPGKQIQKNLQSYAKIKYLVVFKDLNIVFSSAPNSDFAEIDEAHQAYQQSRNKTSKTIKKRSARATGKAYLIDTKKSSVLGVIPFGLTLDLTLNDAEKMSKKMQERHWNRSALYKVRTFVQESFSQ